MAGCPAATGSMFYGMDIEDRIRPDHPLPPIRRGGDETLADLTRVFAGCYSGVSRPSVTSCK